MGRRVRLGDPPTETKDKRRRRGSAHHRSILDKKLIKDICDLLKEGVTIGAVCDYLSISPSAFLEWRKWGELYSTQEKIPKEYKIYVIFLLKSRKAHAKYIIKRQMSLNNPKNSNWVRDMAILERRDRANYGRKGFDYDDVEEFDPDERFF